MFSASTVSCPSTNCSQRHFCWAAYVGSGCHRPHAFRHCHITNCCISLFFFIVLPLYLLTVNYSYSVDGICTVYCVICGSFFLAQVIWNIAVLLTIRWMCFASFFIVLFVCIAAFWLYWCISYFHFCSKFSSACAPSVSHLRPLQSPTCDPSPTTSEMSLMTGELHSIFVGYFFIIRNDDSNPDVVDQCEPNNSFIILIVSWYYLDINETMLLLSYNQTVLKMSENNACKEEYCDLLPTVGISISRPNSF